MLSRGRKPLSTDGKSTVFATTLPPDITAKVIQFEQDEGCTRSEAVRMLITMGLSATAEEVLYSARVNRAYTEAKVWIREQLQIWTQEMGKLLELSVRMSACGELPSNPNSANPQINARTTHYPINDISSAKAPMP